MRDRKPIDRRSFISTTCAASTAVCLASSSLTWGEEEKEKQRYKKSVKIGMVQVKGSLQDKFAALKELGFDGIELDAPSGLTVEEVRAASEATGLPVHGVVDSVHWNQRLSDPSEEVRAKGLEALKTAIKFSKDVGGTSVLLVPGRVTPDATYEQAWERSITEIKKATPLAEELGIDILMENVWNDFLTDPKETARFVDACGSDRVGAYFDVGNAVRYSPPHEWIPILGKRIKKLDIKDYKLQPEGGNLGAGFSAKLLEGSVDWPKVMDELEKIEYSGWGTAEIQGGDKVWLQEVAERMNKIFAS
jgi:L-ribulose-5-phosphate 3-epimerase